MDSRQRKFHGALCLLLLMVCLAGYGAWADDINLTPRPGFVLIKARITEAGIPALMLSQKTTNHTRRPVVILIHGGAAVDPFMTPGLPYKEEWFRPVYEDVPYRLAENGMLVISIDAAWAESRIPPEARSQVEANPLKAILSFWMASVNEIPRIIRYLHTRSDVDPSRIGLAGKSGGAIVSLMAACQKPSPSVVVSWKGGADLAELARLKGQGDLMETTLAQDPVFRTTLEGMDPIFNFTRIPPTALALINNREDPAVPRVCAELLYDKLKPLYEEHPDRLFLKLCDTNQPTHDDQLEAFDAGYQWLIKHL